MDIDMFIVGKKYRVKSNHNHHPGYIGRFNFLAGKNQELVILDSLEDSRKCIVVKIEDVEKEPID